MTLAVFVQAPDFLAGDLGFLCRYLHSEQLRREIHEGLNVIEQWNRANDTGHNAEYVREARVRLFLQ
jgi:hypothetical protein